MKNRVKFSKTSTKCIKLEKRKRETYENTKSSNKK